MCLTQNVREISVREILKKWQSWAVFTVIFGGLIATFWKGKPILMPFLDKHAEAIFPYVDPFLVKVGDFLEKHEWCLVALLIYLACVFFWVHGRIFCLLFFRTVDFLGERLIKILPERRKRSEVILYLCVCFMAFAGLFVSASMFFLFYQIVLTFISIGTLLGMFAWTATILSIVIIPRAVFFIWGEMSKLYRKYIKKVCRK
jgi:hypothetical protein